MKKIIFLIMSLALILLIATPVALADEAPLPDPQLIDEYVDDEVCDCDACNDDFWIAWQAEREREWLEREEQLRIEREEFITERGGTIGIVNVIFDGRFIQFDDEIPQIIRGTTFVPTVPFFEAFGASVDFYPQTESIAVQFDDGRIVRLVFEQDSLAITVNDRSTVVPLCETESALVGSDVSFVPLRAVAELLGLDVYWDSSYNSVVIIDSAAKIEAINSNFTIFNSLSGMNTNFLPPEFDKFIIRYDMSASFIEFNTLDGNSEVDFAFDFTVHSDGHNFHLKATIDFTEFLEFIMDDYMFYDPIGAEMLSLLEEPIDIEMIFNLDDDFLYFRSPVLNSFIPIFPANGWVSLNELSDWISLYELDEFFDYVDYILSMAESEIEFLFANMDVGSRLVQNFSWWWWRSPVEFFYRELIDSVELHNSLIGDNNFTATENGYTLSITLGDMLSAIEEFGGGEFLGLFWIDELREFSFELNINIDDGEVTAITGDFISRQSRWSWSPATRYAIEFDISEGDISVTFEMHEQNAMVVSFDLSILTEETQDAVPQRPPAGAIIISIDDLLSNFIDDPGIFAILLEM